MVAIRYTTSLLLATEAGNTLGEWVVTDRPIEPPMRLARYFYAGPTPDEFIRGEVLCLAERFVWEVQVFTGGRRPPRFTEGATPFTGAPLAEQLAAVLPAVVAATAAGLDYLAGGDHDFR